MTTVRCAAGIFIRNRFKLGVLISQRNLLEFLFIVKSEDMKAIVSCISLFTSALAAVPPFLG